MSMVSHGRPIEAWVCRCSIGLSRAARPRIHILAGEKVCIQVITPMQLGSALAASISARMASRSLSVGRCTIDTGMASAPSSRAATSWDWAVTCSRVSGP